MATSLDCHWCTSVSKRTRRPTSPSPKVGGHRSTSSTNHREFPNAKNNKIVGMNVDTLYSLANVDLSAEPIVLVVPPMQGNRWWIMQIIDGWNDVPAAPGSRTHGGKGGNFALVGPQLQGQDSRRPGDDPCRYQPRRYRRAHIHGREGRL